MYCPACDSESNYFIGALGDNDYFRCRDCGMSFCEVEQDEYEADPDYDDSMDGDHASALASAGFGTDEDYGCFDSGSDW